MKWIVNKEKPLHKLVYLFVFAAFAVVQEEQGNGKENAKPDYPVNDVYWENVYYNICAYEQKTPDYLFFDIAAVETYRKHAKRGYAALVGRKR